MYKSKVSGLAGFIWASISKESEVPVRVLVKDTLRSPILGLGILAQTLIVIPI